MIGPRNVHPDELGDAEGMEVQDALRVGNRLIEGIDDLPMPATEDFSDRVMAALAKEPTPGTTGFLVPLRRRGFLTGLPASVRQAWASVGSGRPMLGRSAALAYVLAVLVAGASLTGAATLGAAGALGLLNPTATPAPTPVEPAPTVAPSIPPPTVPPPSLEASEPPVGPTPTASETDNEGPDASDDHGGNSGPGGGGDDNSGPGSDDSGSGSGGNSGPGGGDDGSAGGGNSGPGSSGSGSEESGRGSDDSNRR